MDTEGCPKTEKVSESASRPVVLLISDITNKNSPAKLKGRVHGHNKTVERGKDSGSNPPAIIIHPHN